jgi:hypothetical protein
MPNFKYALEPYKTPASRYACPECGVPKKFTRYIDTETNDYLADYVGKCDRDSSCGYHYTPKKYYAVNPAIKLTKTLRNLPAPSTFQPSYIPQKLYERSLNRSPELNDFLEYLSSIFDDGIVNKLIEDYNIGTAKYWPHATIFWQVDRKYKVRTGKIMLYDPYTGKRVKQPYAHVTWAHTLLKKPNYNLQQVFFGEHLIAPGDTKIVCIVESEKTAIIAAGYLPEHTWVAAGSLEGLTLEKCRVLHGRQVMLVPDLDAYPKWEKKMNHLKGKMPGTRFGMGKFLQDLSPEEQTPGMDIADWLISVRQSESA